MKGRPPPPVHALLEKSLGSLVEMSLGPPLKMPPQEPELTMQVLEMSPTLLQQSVPVQQRPPAALNEVLRQSSARVS
jgi:hypothetical protein